MKNLNVYDLFGNKLFTGTRHEVKQYIRYKKIKRYILKETFNEKILEIKDKKTKVTEKEFNEIFV